MKNVRLPIDLVKLGCSLLIVVLLSPSLIQAQTRVTNSTIITVGEGTTFSNGEDMLLDGGGTLNNQGTIVVKGSLVNNNTSLTNLGSGTFEFSGTSAQTISGPNQFANVVINNAAGVSLGGSYDNQVTGTLSLTNGLLKLESTNLLLASTALIGGTPSASKMIVPTGTGELRKEFSGTGSFTYPVGDNDAPAEYSPVTANFTSGTFGSGNYLGVSLKNQADPDMSIATGDFLNRYWTLNNNGITGTISCNLTFAFLTADVVGNVTNLYCIKSYPTLVTYDKYSSGNVLTGTVSGFSRFTGARAVQTSALAAFLEGPNNGAGAMTTVLRTFTSLNSDAPFPLLQPYTGSPWNYPGSESVGTVPAGVVDWVLIELRQASAPENATAATIFARRAAFLKSDGSIVDIDGVSPLKFYNAAYNPANNVYAVVKQRNHLAIMSGNAVTKDGSGIFSYDFTDNGSKTYGYPDGIKQVGGKWSMIAGNGKPDANIDSDDITFSWNLNAGNFDGYYSGDFNLNGSVDSDDITFYWNLNAGLFGNITDHFARGYHSMVP
jgi:hypothetical protein